MSMSMGLQEIYFQPTKGDEYGFKRIIFLLLELF